MIMKVNIVGRQMNVYEETKEIIGKKLSKLDKYFPGDREPEAVVTLSRKRNVSTMEVTINAGGTLFRSEVDSDDFRSAVDKTVDNIERQIRKNKTRLEKRLRQGAFERALDVEDFSSFAPDEPEEGEYHIVRSKTFPIKPMTREEAILQMNLLEHTFFAFKDEENNGAFAVVYKRNDGGYGLIENID